MAIKTGYTTVNLHRKAKDGTNGKTPYVGDNGNWWIDGTDTGRPSRGDDGYSPQVGENGNWWEWDADQGKYTDTGIQAKGVDAHSPYVNASGNWMVWDDTQQKYVDSGKTSKGDEGHSPYIGDDGYWYEYDAAQGKYIKTSIKAHGDKGDNAVQYEIDVLSLTRTPNTPNTTYTVKWKARAYKTVGSERTPLSEDGYSIFANVGNGWKGYGTEGKYIFDDDDDFGLVTATSITFGLFLGNSAIEDNLLTTTVINFGEKGDKGNQGKRGASIRPCGEWKEGVTYVHDNDWIDVVIHNGEYYAVVEGKTATDIEPPHAAYWEEANKQRFVATDLLLTDTMYAKVLDAVNARIDELVVKRLETLSETGAHIAIQDGLMEVTAYGASTPNIKFGVDESGYAVLKYYDMSGNLLYNLGPEGIMKQISTSLARYVENVFNDPGIGSNSDNVSDIIQCTSVTFYRWYQGLIRVNSVYKYHAYYEGTVQGENAQDGPYAVSGKFVETREPNGTAPVSGDFMCDGYYLSKDYKPRTAEWQINNYTVVAIKEGIVIDEFVIYVVTDNNVDYVCDMGGNHVASNMSIREYRQMLYPDTPIVYPY